jgi:hypothetical protein
MKDRHEYEQAVLPIQEAYHSAFLEKARAAAVRLAKLAGNAGITADDIHDVCPVPKGIDPRVLGGVFKPKELWELVGYQKSRRSKQNHGRPISIWRLR